MTCRHLTFLILSLVGILLVTSERSGANPASGLVKGDVTVVAFRITEPTPLLDHGDCPGDANGDHVVNVIDLLEVLRNWGTCNDACPADFNNDGTIGIRDLLIMLANHGMHCE